MSLFAEEENKAWGEDTSNVMPARNGRGKALSSVSRASRLVFPAPSPR